MRNRILKSINLNFLKLIIALFITSILVVGCGGGGGEAPHVGNTSPTATITNPSDGNTYLQGDLIEFNCIADDNEDGTLTGNSLVWTSSIDGQIGTGASCSTTSLSVGIHTITLTATDSDGAIGNDSIGIIVPKELTVGIPMDETITSNSSRPYLIPVTPSSIYYINITRRLDNVTLQDIYLFNHGGDSTFNSNQECLQTYPLSNESIGCIAIANNDMLYITVDGSYSDVEVSYTVLVELMNITNLNLSTPLDESVTQFGAKVFSVNVVPGILYTASITGPSDNVDFLVIDDSFTNSICSGVRDCTLETPETKIHIAVNGNHISSTTATYTVLVTPAPIIDNPINENLDIPIGTPTIGQVATRGESFYSVTGLTPGESYTVSLTGLTGGAYLQLGLDCTLLYTTECTFEAWESVLNFSVRCGPVNREGAGYIILVW